MCRNGSVRHLCPSHRPPAFSSPCDDLRHCDPTTSQSLTDAILLPCAICAVKQSHRGLFCDAGVWRLCQHPNWLGDLCLWCGILLLNVPTLLAQVSGQPPVRRWLRLAAATLSPLFLLALFNSQATDTIGNAVALMKKRYGSDPRFMEWYESTPLLLPTLGSIRRMLSGR